MFFKLRVDVALYPIPFFLQAGWSSFCLAQKLILSCFLICTLQFFNKKSAPIFNGKRVRFRPELKESDKKRISRPIFNAKRVRFHPELKEFYKKRISRPFFMGNVCVSIRN